MKRFLSFFSMRGKQRARQADGSADLFVQPEYNDEPAEAVPSVSSDPGLAEDGKRIISSLFSNLWQNVLSSAEEDPELFSVPPVPGIREEDVLLRRGGFSGEPGEEGEIRDDASEMFRLLLDRAGEAKEILSRLNETADEIRRELTT